MHAVQSSGRSRAALPGVGAWARCAFCLRSPGSAARDVRGRRRPERGCGVTGSGGGASRVIGRVRPRMQMRGRVPVWGPARPSRGSRSGTVGRGSRLFGGGCWAVARGGRGWFVGWVCVGWPCAIGQCVRVGRVVCGVVCQDYTFRDHFCSWSLEESDRTCTASQATRRSEVFSPEREAGGRCCLGRSRSPLMTVPGPSWKGREGESTG